ncbi:hypothetical protein VIBNISFn118_1800005 [Vibrio nigripulchritudo SFn118]|nr:hypothetical protein VIBNISFn118_1800005 [Vibrio nigripulchritudo SFn118]
MLINCTAERLCSKPFYESSKSRFDNCYTNQNPVTLVRIMYIMLNKLSIYVDSDAFSSPFPFKSHSI